MAAGASVERREAGASIEASASIEAGPAAREESEVEADDARGRAHAAKPAQHAAPSDGREGDGAAQGAASTDPSDGALADPHAAPAGARPTLAAAAATGWARLRGGGCATSKVNPDAQQGHPPRAQAQRSDASVAASRKSLALPPGACCAQPPPHPHRERAPPPAPFRRPALRCAALGGKLVAHDFSALWDEKRAAHLEGTREWAFAEVQRWLDDAASAQQLSWLMGGGGTGKSVLTAALHARIFNRVIAWHYCRHDDPQASAPAALLRSLAAMLCHRLPGYAGALVEVPGETVADPKELFAALFEVPLKAVEAPETLLIIIDALDELPKESQKSLLAVIAGQLSQLPRWLKLFVTSREEPQIKVALATFKPQELRADEAKNRTDVEVYLRTIARDHVKGEVNMANIEAAVKRRYGINVQGKLASLQTPMDMSKAVYSKVHQKLSGRDGYKALLGLPSNLNSDLVQTSDDFETVYFKQAPAAQARLMSLIADEWVEDPNKATLQHPAEGKARPWVEFADSPGIKGEPRSREKMKNDYANHANKLKDLARLTLRFTSCGKMAAALTKELGEAGIQQLTLKNKYASPTPMGYSDFNLCVGVRLDDDTLYVCEMQLNLVEMLEAKHEAHVYYEKVRRELPALCSGTTVDPGELEGFIVGQLSTSALDAAVEALSQKADGLFLYAHLLAKHLESEEKADRPIDFAGLDALPAGLGEVYAANFARAFPAGKEDPLWLEAKPLIELIAAAREPITETMAAALLVWDEVQQARVLKATALLFPVREDKFHVFHKTVVDWLTGEIAEGSSVKERSEVFQVQRADGHATFATGFVAWLGAKTDKNEYWLQHGIVHLCRAQGRAGEAAKVYAGDLALLHQRLDAGLLASVAKDFLELLSCADVDLTAATQMRRFVGKYTDVLQKEGGAAVSQLATQQPDASAACMALATAPRTGRTLAWRNKPQQADPCIATLSHQGQVNTLAVSETRIIGGVGTSLVVYDAKTQELLEELEGKSNVKAVALAKQTDSTELMVAGYEDGTIKVWDSGAKSAQNRPSLAKSDNFWLAWQVHWSSRQRRPTPTAITSDRSPFRPTERRSCPDQTTRRSKSGIRVRFGPQIAPPAQN